jgi:suppressor for copper-sensitivity B
MVYILPKPGMWMIKVKQLMALFLAATILWLLYIMSDNIGNFGAAIIAILTLLFFSAIKQKSVLKRFILMSLIIASAFATAMQFNNQEPKQLPLSENIWLNFSEELLNNSLKEGKVVVIDITADW